eukprot:4706308-Prymnesium_polylepis.2
MGAQQAVDPERIPLSAALVVDGFDGMGQILNPSVAIDDHLKWTWWAGPGREIDKSHNSKAQLQVHTSAHKCTQVHTSTSTRLRAHKTKDARARHAHGLSPRCTCAGCH